MPIENISRQVQSVSVSTTYHLVDPNIGLIVANATSSGFTITLYNDLQSGAYHRVVVRISDSDSSGNTVTIVDAAAAFSTTLASTSAAVLIETDQSGAWYAVATFPTEDAATAISAADSAGLVASSATSTAKSGTAVATSEATSAGAAGAVALSAATSGTTLATSEATSAGAAGAVALSAATSGTTLATSEATSAGLKGTAALSAATSAGALASSAMSLAMS